MDCCDAEKEPDSCQDGSKRDYLYIAVLFIGSALYLAQLLNPNFLKIAGRPSVLFHSFFELMNIMWWGIALGIIFVGILGRVPREYVISLFGKAGTKSSILRATIAGLALDLCNHGILMVGMKLYERGASIGQVMAFLIASPWNSFSLTVILIALVGLEWTLAFILLSGVIAIISGILFDYLVKVKVLPSNPYTKDIPENFNFFQNLKQDFKKASFGFQDWKEMFIAGLHESKMIIKWIVLGAIISSVIKAYVDTEIFQQYFGPSLIGLGATLFMATIIEVCSEGSTPIAADLLQRAKAPGNSFTFLMAGVSTDYTEILSLRSTTKSWMIALFLPLITVPQILLIAYFLN